MFFCVINRTKLNDSKNFRTSGKDKVDELEVKLEMSKRAIRKLSESIGTIIVSSSSDEEVEECSPKSHDIDQQDAEFASKFTYTTNVNADRYYLDGRMRISKSNVDILKGMNSHLTSTKDHDYRFISRLLLCVFEKDELANGCVKIEGSSNNKPTKYNALDPLKFDFVMCKKTTYFYFYSKWI